MMNDDMLEKVDLDRVLDDMAVRTQGRTPEAHQCMPRWTEEYEQDHQEIMRRNQEQQPSREATLRRIDKNLAIMQETLVELKRLLLLGAK